MKGLSTAQKVALTLAFVGAGALHFLKTEAYVTIMPPYLPWHRALVLVSGFFEMLGGAGLLVSAVRRAAAWGLVALLIAVFPANLYMATHPVEAGAAALPAVVLWLRLPVQFLLIVWILWCTKTHFAAR
jgi:uncharacterized membrane protein